MRSLAVLATTGVFLTLACGSSSRDGFASDPSEPGFVVPDAGTEEDPSCVGSVAPTAKSSVDIIFVIDNSNSMQGEMDQVRDNINSFVAKIGERGHDSHVLFIVNKTRDLMPKICVPAPLAGADCADNPPRFWHINESVWDGSSLKAILSTFDSEDATLAWNKYVRRDAFKVFVEVSDDGRLDLDANDFDTKLLAKPGAQFGVAARRNYVYHAICGWKEGTAPLSSEKCETADGNGLTYQRLALLTGGTIESVCKTDYSGVLDKIGNGIVDRLACDLGYPTSNEADPLKVQVRLTTADKTEKFIPLTDASKCTANPNGWYYDDPIKPAKILLCDGACNAANAVAGAKVEALVGCRGPAPR